MKKTFQKVICAAMILSMALPFAACGNKDEIWSTETTSPEDRAFLDPDATTITFGVPMFCHFDVEHLKLFNEELLKDGHKYQLKISGFEYDFEDTKYFENIAKMPAITFVRTSLLFFTSAFLITSRSLSISSGFSIQSILTSCRV